MYAGKAAAGQCYAALAGLVTRRENWVFQLEIRHKHRAFALWRKICILKNEACPVTQRQKTIKCLCKRLHVYYVGFNIKLGM